MREESTDPPSEKGPVSRKYKEHLQFKKETKSPVNTWATSTNSHFEECGSNPSGMRPFHTHWNSYDTNTNTNTKTGTHANTNTNTNIHTNTHTNTTTADNNMGRK